LITALCTLLGLGYAVTNVKPTYTATRSVILRLSVGDLQANTVTTNVALSKIYLPDVIEFVSSPAVVNKANELNGGNSIKNNSINVKYSNKEIESLIFSISYTDAKRSDAEKKLNYIIESVMLVDDEMKVIEAEEFSLIPTQNGVTTSVNNKFSTFVVLGFGVGLVLSIALAVLIYMFDNTISTKEELEALTGSDMLSTLKKVKEPKKRNK
jgi:capsular polysaccharide biosynthesis protein